MISIKKNENITYHDLEKIENHFFGKTYLIEVLRGNPHHYKHEIEDMTTYTEHKFLKDYADGKIFVLKDNPFSPALKYIREKERGYWTLNSTSNLFFDSSVKWLAKTVRPHEGIFNYATVEEYRQIEETRYQETPLADTTPKPIVREEVWLVEIKLKGMSKAYLQKDFAKKINNFISKLKVKKIDISVNEAFRTNKEQQALLTNKNAITPAKGGTSLHEAGFAVDVNWSRIAKENQDTVVSVALECGIKWGGKFTKKADPVHFYHEVPGGRQNRSKYIEKAQKYYANNYN